MFTSQRMIPKMGKCSHCLNKPLWDAQKPNKDDLPQHSFRSGQRFEKILSGRSLIGFIVTLDGTIKRCLNEDHYKIVVN